MVGQAACENTFKGSKITVDLKAGETYFFVADGFTTMSYQNNIHFTIGTLLAARCGLDWQGI